MPIEVRHGEPPAGILAILAAIAGQGQQRAPEIPRMANLISPVGGGGGGGIRQRPSMMPRLGQVTRPSKPTPEEEAEAQAMKAAAIQEATMTLKLEQQQMEAEYAEELRLKGMKLEYSMKSKQKIAEINESRRMVATDPKYADIKEEALRALDLQMIGITKDAMPAGAGELHPPGRGPQDIWTDPETGDRIGFDRNMKPVVKTPFEKTPKGREEAHQRAMELKQAEWEMTALKEQAKVRRELLMEKDPVSGARLYNPIQVEGIMRELFPTAEVGLPGAPAGQMGPTDVELEEELRRRIDAQTLWWEGPVSRGRKVLPAEREAPPQVGQALMYAREAMEKYKTPGRIPSAVIAEIQRSKPLIDQWRRSERPRPAARPQREGEVSLAVREANARLQEAEDRYGTLDKIPPELIPALKRDLELVQQHTQGGGR